MKYLHKEDEWKDIRDKLFKPRRRKIVVSREGAPEPFEKEKGKISATYVRVDGRNVAIKLSSDEPFNFPKYPDLDEDSEILEVKENKITYSLGKRGQEFTLANNILNYMLKNNPGTFIYAHRRWHHFYEQKRKIAFESASKLEGDKIYINRVEKDDRIDFRFVSKRKFFSPGPTPKRNNFEVDFNKGRGGISIATYSFKKNGAESLSLDFILDETRRINQAEFD